MKDLTNRPDRPAYRWGRIMAEEALAVAKALSGRHRLDWLEGFNEALDEYMNNEKNPATKEDQLPGSKPW